MSLGCCFKHPFILPPDNTHWFEVSIAQPSQMDSRKESLAATPSSLSSASSPQCDSLPYYKQDDTMEDEHFAGSHNGRHFEKQFCIHIKTSFNVYPSLGYPYSYTAIDHVQQKGC